MKKFIIAISYCLLTTASPVQSTQKCYYLDGHTLSTVDTPCDSSTRVSACCGPDSICLDNGLCFDAGVYSRGSCTDSGWSEPCNKVCADKFPQGGMALTPCSIGTRLFACDLPNLEDSSQGNCLDNFTITGGSQFVMRPEQLVNLGISEALTLGGSATIPVNTELCVGTATLSASTVSS